MLHSAAYSPKYTKEAYEWQKQNYLQSKQGVMRVRYTDHHPVDAFTRRAA